MRERIIELRKALGYSQAAFAEKIGISRNFLNRYENGNREMSDRTIKTICSMFKVNEKWLRTGESEMYIEPSPMEELVEKVAALRTTITNNEDPDAVALAKFKERMATLILNLNDDACSLVIKFIEDLGFTKKEEDE